MSPQTSLAGRPVASEQHTELYRFIERHGAVAVDTVVTQSDIDSSEADAFLSDLEQAGFVEEADGIVSVTEKPGLEERDSIHGLEFTIRPARGGDVPDLTAMLRRYNDVEEYLVFESVRDTDTGPVEYGPGGTPVVFVVSHEEQVIGWILLETRPSMGPEDTAQQTIGLSDPYRSAGILSRLMQWGYGWAADKGFTRLYTCLPSTVPEAFSPPESNDWSVSVVSNDRIAVGTGYVSDIQQEIDPAEESVRSDQTDLMPPADRTVNEYLALLEHHLDRAMRADEMSEARFHIRHGLQYEELVLAELDS